MEMKPMNINVNSGTPGQVRSFEVKRGMGFQSESQKEETPGRVKDKKFTAKILDKAIGLSIFMLFFGLPVFFTGLALQGIIFEKQLYFYFWLLLGLVSWAAKGVIEGEMNIRRTPLDIPVIGFWLVYLLTVFFSVDRWHSFWGAFGDPSRGFMSVTALVIAYYLIMSNFNLKRLRLILAALIGSGLVVSLWTLAVILNITNIPPAIAAYLPISLIGSMSGLGVFLSVLVILIAIAILKISENEGMGKLWKNFLLAVLSANLLLNLFLILALWNFVPWLALFIGVAIFVVFILARIMRPRGVWAMLPMALFVAIMILRLTGAVNISKIELPVEVSLGYQASWDIAKESLKNKFLAGSGPATYGYDSSLYRTRELNDNNFYNLRFLQGSGAVFEAIPTIGGIGTLFFLLAVLSFLSVEIYFICRNKEKNKLYSLGFFSAFAILLASVIGAKAEGTIYFLAALIGAVALAVTLKESEAEERYLGLSLKASPKFALALAFVFMVVSAGVAFAFVFLGKVYAADVYAGAAARKAVAGSEQDSIASLGSAINLYSREGGYYLKAGQYYMAMVNKEAVKGEKERDVQKIQQFLNYSISAVSQGKNMNKNDVNSTEALAQIYENAGMYVPDSISLAIETYQKGSELEPKNPDFYLKIGMLKISLAASSKDDNQKKQLVEEAKEMFQRSTDMKGNYDPGYFQMSLAQEALGDADGAIESGRKAVELNSRNENYVLALARMYQARGGSANSKEDNAAAEQLYKYAAAQNDASVNGHFYLGLFYEKNKNKQGAKDEYRKVVSLLGENSQDTRSQLEKMIANVDAGIENTPETLGLIQKQEEAVAPE
ncbi:MAG: hypothetical protein A2288_02975 [Candidatus Moranbacteria bacterium RIFOXYA12_FULL_44_15]|nr:MAG: hypothetical protein A2288_02975 [Candidatus Moranbacteria bacterium RIFOXYA12_FULL_44_15]OGI35415.1 MAG: hypothetical protein A2259_03060 [Candidatus Moranbacteria bacterium RIFOXYA2_FULL_43_15]